MLPKTILVAHPSPDLYGSDLQLLESVRGLLEFGYRVVVTIPRCGPLAEHLEQLGAQIQILETPVLRKSALSPIGLIRLFFASLTAVFSQVRMLRRMRPEILYVNTITIPSWLIAAQLTRSTSICHVHEAEDRGNRLIRKAIISPLWMADCVLVNSNASRHAIVKVAPSLDHKLSKVYNGINGPDYMPQPPPVPSRGDEVRIALVARLSPRKGIDIALEAIAELRREGRNVKIEICGSVFPGYEWFEDSLRRRAAQPDLIGAVRFSGYVSPVWPMLAASHMAVVPSRAEPFGNTAVEAQLAMRPVVVSDTQGLREIVVDRVTGLLFQPGSSIELAQRLRELIESPDLGGTIALNGYKDAHKRFSTDRYRSEICQHVARLDGRVPLKLGGRKYEPDVDDVKHQRVMRSFRPALNRAKYALKMPEGKRYVERIFAVRVAMLPGFPHRARLVLLRRIGIEVAHASISHSVTFRNTNVRIEKGAVIKAGTRFLGTAAIVVGENVTISKNSKITTRVEHRNPLDNGPALWLDHPVRLVMEGDTWNFGKTGSQQQVGGDT